MDKIAQISPFALHSPHWSKHFVIGPLMIDFSLQQQKDNKKPSWPGVRNRLAVVRSERGVSRRELALALDVRPMTLEAVECGEYTPSLELAYRISSFFSLPIDAIFLYK
jgi:putative transcriptional regulator